MRCRAEDLWFEARRVELGHRPVHSVVRDHHLIPHRPAVGTVERGDGDQDIPPRPGAAAQGGLGRGEGGDGQMVEMAQRVQAAQSWQRVTLREGGGWGASWSLLMWGAG